MPTSIDADEAKSRAEAVRRLKKFSKGRTLGVPGRQLIEEGRR